MAYYNINNNIKPPLLPSQVARHPMDPISPWHGTFSSPNANLRRRLAKNLAKDRKEAAEAQSVGGVVGSTQNTNNPVPQGMSIAAGPQSASNLVSQITISSVLRSTSSPVLRSAGTSVLDIPVNKAQGSSAAAQKPATPSQSQPASQNASPRRNGQVNGQSAGNSRRKGHGAAQQEDYSSSDDDDSSKRDSRKDSPSPQQQKKKKKKPVLTCYSTSAEVVEALMPECPGPVTFPRRTASICYCDERREDLREMIQTYIAEV